MLKRKIFAFTGGLIVSAALSIGWGGAQAQNTELRFVTGPTGGSFYTLGSAVAEIIEREVPGVKVTVQPGGSVGNVQAIEDGKAEIGLAGAGALGTALAGVKPFKSPVKKIRHLASFWYQPWQFGINANSGIKSVMDLKGKRVAVNTRGSVGEQLSRHVLQVHGLSYSDLGKAEFISGNTAATAMKNRRIDAWTVVGPMPYAFFLDVATSIDLDFVSISEDKIQEVLKLNDGYLRIEIPAGTYEGVNHKTVTVGDRALFIGSADLDDDIAAGIAKALAAPGNIKKLRTVMATLKNTTLQSLMDAGKIQQHPGATKGYKEAGR